MTHITCHLPAAGAIFLSLFCLRLSRKTDGASNALTMLLYENISVIVDKVLKQPALIGTAP